MPLHDEKFFLDAIYTECQQNSNSDITICQQCQLTYDNNHLQLRSTPPEGFSNNKLMKKCCDDPDTLAICSQIGPNCNHLNMDDVEICDRCQITQVTLYAFLNQMDPKPINPQYNTRIKCCNSQDLFLECSRLFSNGPKKLFNLNRY